MTETLDEALWRLPTVIERTGLKRDAIYEAEAAGTFPARRQIGARAVAWLASEVIAWMRSTPAAGTNNGTPNPRAAKNRMKNNSMAA